GIEAATSNGSGRYAANNLQRRHVLGHHGTGGHDGAAPDGNPGHDHGPRTNPDVILDHDRPTDHGKGGIVVQMLVGQNGDLGRDAHIVANGQGHPGVQAAVAVDVAVLSNTQAPS